jgi:thioesterase domain-containing protein
MVPERFVTVDSLPHTTSGKIDRRALADVDESSSEGASGESTLPLDAMEIEIAEVWSEVLGVARIGRGQHFFLDLGGHSLLALRLLGRAGAQWPEVPDLATFLADPTIEGMAAAIRAVAPTTAGVVRMNSRGTRRPLFIVHPALGSALCFVELARSLGADRPLIAFQAPGLEGDARTEDDLVALARRHVVALRSEQPSGPYLLAGYSFGGVVAYEMARQLHDMCAEVEQLIVLDTIAPVSGGDSRVLVDDARLLAEIATTLERYAGIAPSVQASDLEPLPPEDQLRWVRQRLVERGVLEGGADVLRLDRMLAVSRASVVARACYDPGRYRGALTLVRCQDPTDGDVEDVARELLDDPALGWSSWCSSVSVSRVPGGHVSLMRQPAVGDVAEVIANALRDAE